MRARRFRSRTTHRRPEELAVAAPAPTQTERLGPHYAAGPALRLGAEPGQTPVSAGMEGLAPAPAAPTPVPDAQGAGHPERVSAYQHGPLRLEGRTDATYDGGRFRTQGVRVARAEGCEGCDPADCVRVTGTLVATYHVDTTVTLPSAADYPDLTPCQRRRVQNAITTVLAPHEQQHVAAFRQYNGTTRTPFDLTICRTDFDARIQTMFEAQEQARRAAAQAASDALDPFHFDVDLNCEEPAPRAAATGSALAEAPPKEES